MQASSHLRVHCSRKRRSPITTSNNLFKNRWRATITNFNVQDSSFSTSTVWRSTLAQKSSHNKGSVQNWYLHGALHPLIILNPAISNTTQIINRFSSSVIHKVKNDSDVEQKQHNVHFDRFLQLMEERMHQKRNSNHMDSSGSKDVHEVLQGEVNDHFNIKDFNKNLMPDNQSQRDKSQSKNERNEMNDLFSPSLSDLMNDFDRSKPPSKDDLHALQLWHECESYSDTLELAEEDLSSARKRHDYASIGKVKRHLLHWYTPLKNAIEIEQKAILNAESGVESRKNGYGPYLLTLKADKLAVITSHEAIGILLRAGGGAYEFQKAVSKSNTIRGGGVKVISLALEIADAIEAEVSVERVIHKTAEQRRKKMKSFGETSSEMGNQVEAELETRASDATNGKAMFQNIGKPYSESAFEEFLPSNQKDGKRRKRNRAKAKAKKILLTDDNWPKNSE